MVVKSYTINDSREYIADNEVRGSNLSMGDTEAQRNEKTPPDDQYDPYANRNVKHPTSYLVCFVLCISRKVTLVFLIICELGANCIYVIFVASNLKAVSKCMPSGKYICIPCKNVVEWKRSGSNKLIPFSFSTQIMPLENEMKNPKKFSSKFGVLNVAMLSIAIIYAAFGFFGYLKYGEEVAGSITLNLPPTEMLAQAVRVMQSVAIFCTFAIPHYIVFDIMWNRYIKLKLEKNACTLLWEYVFRTAIVILTFLCAVMVPNLELFISFNGALCLPFMSIGFPAIVDLLTFWDHHQGAGKVFFVLKNILVILIGLVGFVTGLNASVSAMYMEIFHKKEV
ncbi:proton-coupled amino acid transporter-like protein pathetic [Diaphorina citri]|uniref:Proton-coupled amino acid transporter-like protein pathetic n=1 Tax=Diaphorina citri TaxID=121845 RepID=A0A3Q0JE41_DIACI|nr:proton-coupled amino acid transporter-like protein pathetic [Diaphorina citri]